MRNRLWLEPERTGRRRITRREMAKDHGSDTCSFWGLDRGPHNKHRLVSQGLQASRWPRQQDTHLTRSRIGGGRDTKQRIVTSAASGTAHFQSGHVFDIVGLHNVLASIAQSLDSLEKSPSQSYVHAYYVPPQIRDNPCI
jgi:hypothetical protein